jgi:hypothetical protein
MNKQSNYSKYIRLLLLIPAVILSNTHASDLNPYKTDSNSSFWPVEIEGCQLNTMLLYSVSLAESVRDLKQKNTVKAWPYSFHSPKGSHYAEDVVDASIYLDELLEKYSKVQIDVGMMQVNLFWHEDKYTNPRELLALERNLEVGCSILTTALNSSPDDLELGVGRYHHWKDEKRSRKYGKRVLQIWRNLNTLASN